MPTKKIIIISAVVLLCLAVLFIGTVGVLRFGFGIDVFDRSGWKTADDGSSVYLDYYGNPLLSWQIIDGATYYFREPDGAMVTGWLILDNQRYYLDDTGKLQTGWLFNENKTYYLDKTGAAVTGWLTQQNKHYYFCDDGSMAIGWLNTDGKTYYLDENGIMQTGWVKVEDKTYYLDADGCMVTGWLEQETGKYYLDSTGAMATGWIEIENKRYFLGETGEMYTGWLDFEDNRYYLQASGVMAIGQVEIDGANRFFASSGAYVILVNRDNYIPADFKTNLVSLGKYKIDASCKDALEQMINDCNAAGFSCKINNTYRSKSTQKGIWNRKVNQYMSQGYSYEEAFAKTGTSVAYPGTSEHQLGLAVDITGNNAMYKWLAEHCAEYGFILRYPDKKIDKTGIKYEPWHFRYLGVDLAKEITATGLCLEEYMDMLTEQAKQNS
ncbi:MAG: D-alanyl-D-alanine carboxypeptidase family protein [Oscillospiraceae bacterium]|nr:D-alanyl-D-alanine carboxypeptidase family protein [Oscillospiraceae bacterium]